MDTNKTFRFRIQATVSTVVYETSKGRTSAEAWKRLGYVDTALAYGLIRGNVAFEILEN